MKIELIQWSPASRSTTQVSTNLLQLTQSVVNRVGRAQVFCSQVQSRLYVAVGSARRDRDSRSSDRTSYLSLQLLGSILLLSLSKGCYCGSSGLRCRTLVGAGWCSRGRKDRRGRRRCRRQSRESRRSCWRRGSGRRRRGDGREDRSVRQVLIGKIGGRRARSVIARSGANYLVGVVIIKFSDARVTAVPVVAVSILLSQAIQNVDSTVVAQNVLVGESVKGSSIRSLDVEQRTEDLEPRIGKTGAVHSSKAKAIGLKRVLELLVTSTAFGFDIASIYMC